jgi:small conductance mechanosensitive channel
VSITEYVQQLPWGLFVTRAAAIIVVWIIIWILVRYLSGWVTNLDKRVDGFDIDPREMKVLDRLVDYILITVAMMITLAILGVTELLYSALTAAGVISLVIGFAVKDVAANFISGIFILLDQPFVVGDFIEIGGFSGTVSKISLRSTQIETLDGPCVSIPNSKMATDPVTNFSVPTIRRITLNVSVPKESDLTQAMQVLQDVAQAENRLLPDKDTVIRVDGLGEYAVDLLLVCYASSDEFYTTESDLRQRIVEEFQRRGLELAVPVRKNLHPDLSLVGTPASDIESAGG